MALGDSHWFLRAEIFSRPADQAELLKMFFEEFVKNQNELSVKHYTVKYDDPAYPPIWILVEILSFGECVKIARKLTIPYRNKISRSYGQDEKFIINWIHCLASLRNICAHHANLWNREMILIPVKNHKKYGPLFSSSNRLFNYLVILQFFLMKIEVRARWIDQLDELITTCKIDAWHMGFPGDWKKRLEKIENI